MRYSLSVKIGFFDSGVGGYFVAQKIMELMPQYDYVYLADTLFMPYGSLGEVQMYERVTKSLGYLFEKENCEIVILVCNTASAVVLRKIQQTWLVENFPERRVLGMVVPTIEIATGETVGILATSATVESKVYSREWSERYPGTKIIEVAMPTLAELVEKGNYAEAEIVALDACRNLVDQGVDDIVLGCTHYCVLKDALRTGLPKEIKIISQDEFIPLKFKEYLERHVEIESKLSKHETFSLFATGESGELEKVCGQKVSNIEV